MGAVSWEKVSGACKESRAYVVNFWSDPPPKSKATGQDMETKPWKRRGVSRSGSVFLVTMSLALIVLLLVRVQALASCVGCDLESVSTQSHTAPAASPLFAGVVEMQYALSTLTNTVPIHSCEQLRRTVHQRSKEVFGPVRFEP
jgi:hypothetical protein